MAEAPEPPGSRAEAELYYRLVDDLARAVRLEALYEAAIEGIRRVLRVERLSLLLFDDDGVMRFKAWRGLSDTYRAAVEGHSPWARDAVDPDPVVVHDALADEGLASYRPLFTAERIRSLAFIPLVTGGQLLGKFMLYAAEPHRFTARHLEVARAVAGHIAFAVARKKDEEDLARRAGQLAASAAVSGLLAAAADPRDVLPACAQALVDHLGVALARIWLLDDAAATLELRASAGLADPLDGAYASVPVGRLHIGRIALQRAPYLACDLADNAEVAEPAWVLREGLVAFAGYPLLAQGKLLGVLAVFARERLGRDALDALGGVADTVALGIERRRSEQALRLLARAGEVLTGTLDHQGLLEAAATLVVPALADACAVDVPEENRLRRVAMAQVGPAAQAPATPRSLAARAMAEGRAILVAEPADADPSGALSLVSVPLIAGGAVAAVLTAATTGASGRRLRGEDVLLVEELCRRVGAALENALLYREAQQAMEHARQADRRKDEFLAVLGHELRNPLAPIVTALELMKLRGDAFPDERRVIERQVRYVSRLVEDLLDVSRITQGKIELAREPLEVATALAKAVEMVTPLLEKRAHALVIDVPASGLRVEADPVRLAQVFANLLTNAAKYTDPRGHLRVSARREADAVLIAFEDDGIGIAPALLPTLFQPFVQGERSLDRSQGGLGLGLALVRSLVELHRGRVSAHSDGPGRGSRFEVRLPMASGAARVAATGPLPVLTAASGRRRVLVVDDNEDAATLLAEVLRLAGHEVAVAHDGPGALGLVERFVPEVALLDIGLPVMDGYELAARLRARPGSRPIRFAALTGYGTEAERIRSREARFEQHFVKPVDVQAVLSWLT